MIMSNPEYTSLWWPPDRIQATINVDYIVSHLHDPKNHSRLYTLPPWGEGLTSETYLDWILAKAGRLFLILTDIGIPDRIFNLVDKSYDDADLPIAHPNVNSLQLTSDEDNKNNNNNSNNNSNNTNNNDPIVDDRFFHTQWRFLVRGIPPGEHVEFDSENEGVPVEVMPRGGGGRVEKVILSGAVCRPLIRSRVPVGEALQFFEREEVVDEIRSLRRFAHDHVFSVYASYFVDDSIYVLFSGPHERHLMSFLTDPPQQFKKLPKARRRQILVNWPHCLANGLSWLHAHDQRHGAIRPSNVHVDSQFNIFLGQFEALDTLLPPPKINDVEAYQYGAPERWVPSAAIQGPQSPRKATLPSGGRTAPRTNSNHDTQNHRPSTLKFNLTKPFTRSSHPFKINSNNNNNNNRDSILTNSSSRPSSLASQTTAIRVGYPTSDCSSSSSSAASRLSYAPSTSSSGSDQSRTTTTGADPDSRRRRHGLSSSSSIMNSRPTLHAPSISPPHTTNTATTTPLSPVSPTARFPGTPVPVTATTASAVVQSWQSHQTNPHASDIFSLGAVILDIFTYLCKRKLSSFIHHRGAKNRHAGRGGGVADASFHLDRNSGQVTSWITLLDADARKRKDSVFVAVREMLGVVRGMLEREPTCRVSAEDVERSFAFAVAGNHARLHCVTAVHSKGRKVGHGHGHGHGHRRNTTVTSTTTSIADGGIDEYRPNIDSIVDDDDDNALTSKHHPGETTPETKPNEKYSTTGKNQGKRNPIETDILGIQTDDHHDHHDYGTIVDYNNNESELPESTSKTNSNFESTLQQQQQQQPLPTPLSPPKPPNLADFDFGFGRHRDCYKDDVLSDSTSDDDDDDDDDELNDDELDEFDDYAWDTFYHSDHSNSPPSVEGWRDPDLLPNGRCRSSTPYGYGHGNGYTQSNNSLKDPVLRHGIAVVDQ